MFELKQQSRNYRHVGNSPTCRQMSCRLDTLADTTFSCVCDMTETCRRHDTECRRLGKKTTRRHPTCGAKPKPSLQSGLIVNPTANPSTLKPTTSTPTIKRATNTDSPTTTSPTNTASPTNTDRVEHAWRGGVCVTHGAERK